ncbi:MAG: HAMP domain-containing protein [Deltaproteobacteria bacterium]|nr:HAMP domain-containing protein [Deltaproteobacteria bacterium]
MDTAAAAVSALVARARRVVPSWLALLFLIAITTNLLAGWTTSLTIDLMRGLSPFAVAVREQDLAILTYWQPIAYAIAISSILVYLRPVIAYFQRGTPTPAPPIIQRRAIDAPLVVTVLTFIPWMMGVVLFPSLTLLRDGAWTTDLLSQHVYSPLVNGFLASATSYLLIDWLFRTLVVPRVFPEGRLVDSPGSFAPGVRGRLLVFLVAIAFTPLFTMLGLIRAGLMRVHAGYDPATVIMSLATAGTFLFAIFVALGIFLTLVLAQTLTRPLACIADALRRVRGGDLDVRVRVGATDEMGLLENGVNALVETLQDRERILHTFGRIVEPAVRDRLLAGDVGLGGELRKAAVLFCDLRGFTAMAERMPPAEVVATLNEFFSIMTGWVRSCGGYVDKFIGDAMLVVFGLLDERQDGGTSGAAAAIHCALGMRERLAALNASRAAAGHPPLDVSVGVHAGEVLAGRIGAADRHEYTVIGDTVNVAARLQQLCKDSEHAVLVSEDTYELARTAGVRCEVAQRDAVTLRGRREPVRVFALA